MSSDDLIRRGDAAKICDDEAAKFASKADAAAASVAAGETTNEPFFVACMLASIRLRAAAAAIRALPAVARDAGATVPAMDPAYVEWCHREVASGRVDVSPAMHISPEAREARRPIPIEDRAATRHEPIHTDLGSPRPVRERRAAPGAVDLERTLAATDAMRTAPATCACCDDAGSKCGPDCLCRSLSAGDLRRVADTVRSAVPAPATCHRCRGARKVLRGRHQRTVPCPACAGGRRA